MESTGAEGTSKPATAARIYDYYLGGIHHFSADQEAARRIIAQFPSMPLVARENRAFLGRAVQFLVDAGIDQFLDVGSGIPTEGNVHEIAHATNPHARVVYVDIDPVAVAESLELLDGKVDATAIRGDLRAPADILEHPSVAALLDFDRPIALLLAAMLHFVPDDDEAYRVVAELIDALPTGSYVAISAAAAESFAPSSGVTQAVIDVYRERTVTGARSRTHSEFERFFTGLELIEPGVVWLHQWPNSDIVHPEFADNPARSGEWAGMGRKAVPSVSGRDMR
jgi:SAM-dependent methyltransferase